MPRIIIIADVQDEFDLDTRVDPHLVAEAVGIDAEETFHEVDGERYLITLVSAEWEG